MSKGNASRGDGLRALAEGRGLQILAEHLLAEESRIDAVCANPDGDVVLLLEVQGEDDRGALTRALAARSWVAARIGDWLQLSPELPVRTGATVGAQIVGTTFSRETEAAAASLPMGWAELVRHSRAVATTGEPRTAPAQPAASTPTPDPSPPPVSVQDHEPRQSPPGHAPPRTSPPGPAAPSAETGLQSEFRTGLGDEIFEATPHG